MTEDSNAVRPLTGDTGEESAPKNGDPLTQKLLGEHHRLHLQIEELEHELQCLEESLSWRITRPLRHARATVGYLRSFLSLRPHQIFLGAFNDLVLEEQGYRVTGPVPIFMTGSTKGRFPCGWVAFRLADPAGTTHRRYTLYVDSGQGFSEQESYPLNFESADEIQFELPRSVRILRLDPIDPPTSFTCPGLIARERYALRVYLPKLASELKRARNAGQSLFGAIAELGRLVRRGGLLALKQRLLGPALFERDAVKLYKRWIDRVEPTRVGSPESRSEQLASFSYTPVLSVIMPTYNTLRLGSDGSDRLIAYLR